MFKTVDNICKLREKRKTPLDEVYKSSHKMEMEMEMGVKKTSASMASYVSVHYDRRNINDD